MCVKIQVRATKSYMPYIYIHRAQRTKHKNGKTRQGLLIPLVPKETQNFTRFCPTMAHFQGILRFSMGQNARSRA